MENRRWAELARLRWSAAWCPRPPMPDGPPLPVMTSRPAVAPLCDGVSREVCKSSYTRLILRYFWVRPRAHTVKPRADLSIRLFPDWPRMPRYLIGIKRLRVCPIL